MLDWNKLLMDGSQYLFTNYGDAIVAFVFTGASGMLLSYAGSTKNKFLKWVAEQVHEVVVVLNETMVADIKEASADKTITKEEGIRIKNHAIEVATAKIGIIGKLGVRLFAGPVNEFIDSQIEAALAKIKGRF